MNFITSLFAKKSFTTTYVGLVWDSSVRETAVNGDTLNVGQLNDSDFDLEIFLALI